MNLSSKNLKLVAGVIYLLVLIIGLYYLFSFIDLKDLSSYEFIRSHKYRIIEYKNNNFFILTISFFIFSIIWVLLLGFAGPLLLFSGFVFGKWYGLLISLISLTFGATLLYTLAKLFFSDLIRDKLDKRFSNFKNYFKKNELLYFIIYRFTGGGGIPYGIQNVLPVLYNISTKNYFLGTIIGSSPPLFVTIALGSGIENVIDKNEKFDIFSVISSPDIYLPIIGFLIIILLGFLIKKFFFKN